MIDKLAINPLALHQNGSISIILSAISLFFILVEVSYIATAIILNQSAISWSHPIQNLSFEDRIVVVADSVDSKMLSPIFINLTRIHAIIVFNVCVIKNFFVKIQWNFWIFLKIFKFQNTKFFPCMECKTSLIYVRVTR